MDPQLSETSPVAASPGNCKPQSDLKWVFTLGAGERKHISEDVEMTNGLIAGEAMPRRVLGVAADPRAAVSNNPSERR